MTTPTSDCPRTDAADKATRGQSWENQYLDLSSFARTLERELNEANEHIKALEQYHDGLTQANEARFAAENELTQYKQVAEELSRVIQLIHGAYYKEEHPNCIYCKALTHYHQLTTQKGEQKK